MFSILGALNDQKMTNPTTSKTLLLTAAMLAVVRFASAETVVLAPSKDNTLYQNSSGQLSNGKGNYLFVGRTDDPGLIRRGLIRFDLSSIPANATISDVTLTMFSSSPQDNSPVSVSLRKVARDWGEGASNAPLEEGGGTQAQTGDATWIHTFFNSGMWNSAGGDFSGTASASTPVGAADRFYTWSGSGLIADVQGWVGNSAGNFGWAIIGGEGSEETAERFNSRENTSNPPRLTVTYTTPTATPPQLVNISTRMRVQTGENALIGGFIITGNAAKKVILRAIGPSLADDGVAEALANPVMELRAQNGSLLFQNNDWRSDQEEAVQDTGVPPENDLESAIVATLQPGAYTAIVRGANDGTGVGLVEAFDLDTAADSRFVNISTRGIVLTDTNVMIGGFIAAGGSGNTKVLLRAIGPSLSDSGVANPLADPTLRFVTGNGTLIGENDNWQDDPEQAEQIAATGAAPENEAESAFITTIPAGNYTAIVSGKNGGTGVGLVEVFNIR